MKASYARKKIAALLLAICMTLTLLPVTVWGADPAVGLAQGITGTKTIIVTLSSGDFAAAVSHAHFALGGTGGQSIEGIYRDSNTAIRLSLSANIEAAHNLSITADQAAFEAGTATFGTIAVYHATRAAGTATACAGTKDITVRLTTGGAFNAAQHPTNWILAGSSSGENSIATVTYVGQLEVKITLEKSLGSSDQLTLQTKQSAFANVGTAPFLSPLTVGISPSAADVCKIGAVGYPTLSAALAMVTDSTPTTIDILTDINHTGAVQLNNKNLTLNLNGHTLTISTTATAETALIVNGGSLSLTGGGALNISGKSHGVHVNNNGVATVTNAKVSNPALTSGNAAAAYTGGTLTVLGDAVAEGSDDTAVLAASGASVTVNGKALAVKTAVYAGNPAVGGPKPTVHIKGDAVVSGTHADGAGAFAFGGGEITIDGEISVADPNKYIRLNNAYKIKEGALTETTKAGYLTYSDGAGPYNNCVWVKDTASPTPLAAPTGLVWDTATAGVIKAKWDAVAGAQKYAVRLYKGGVYQGLLETNATTLYLTAYLQDFGTGTYTFTVKALAPAGSADYTDSAAATSGPYAYTAPVCKIGAAGYATLGAAITAALNAGGATTITLLQSIDEAAPITVDGAAITFELDSFNLTIDTSAAPGSTALTVQNGGKVRCTGSGKLNVKGAERGVSAVGGSEIHVSGSVIAGKYGVYTSGVTGNPKVTVDGDVTVTGQGASGEVEAVCAGGCATVAVGGNVTANRTADIQVVTAIYSGGSTVVVGKNVTTTGSGVTVQSDGHVTIEGVLIFDPTGAGPQSYIKLGYPVVIKNADDFDPANPRPGYKQYSNGANIVWVRGAAQLAKPAGLAWDTSAGELKAMWTAVPNADQYEVEYYRDGTKLGISTTVSSPGTSTGDMTDNLLPAYGTGGYAFTVRATAASGSGYIDSEVSEPSEPYSHTPGETNYTVTVSGSHAAITGAGSYAPGDTVYIYAGSRSGYTFDGWTSPDVTIPNAGEKDAGFTMPGKAVTVTANWSDNGAAGGGGSADRSITIRPEKKPDQPVTAVAPASVGAGASAAISDKTVTEAIAKARETAKAQGKTANGIVVALEAGEAPLTVSLTQSALQNLVNAEALQFEISAGPVILVFDLEALTEIQRQSGGDIRIGIALAAGLPEQAQALIGGRPVYSVTVSSVKDGEAVSITNLGGGTATISIAYTPGNGEAVGYLFGVYADGTGHANRVPGSVYDAGSGRVILSGSRLAVHGIGYEAPSGKFTDITDHWAKESIDYAVGRGLLAGTSETAFSPDAAMSRAMLVTVLGRLAGVDAGAYTDSSFTDVAADPYYAPYIEWAYEKGIVRGVGNGRFDPDRAVTREEIALIFANYAKAAGYELPVTREAAAFADDSNIGSAYAAAVGAMQQAGVMTGDGGNAFHPKSADTRAEVSAMLHRYVRLTIAPATAQGWAFNDAGQWLCYKEGKALTGTQTLDGTRYFFNSDGALQAGWVKDGGSWYFYSGNQLLTGRQALDGKQYHFGADGTLTDGNEKP